MVKQYSVIRVREMAPCVQQCERGCGPQDHSCVLCGSEEGSYLFMGKPVCARCLSLIREL
jgi:hypothetical protein